MCFLPNNSINLFKQWGKLAILGGYIRPLGAKGLKGTVGQMYIVVMILRPDSSPKQMNRTP